jgi:prephenate dehydrogenase
MKAKNLSIVGLGRLGASVGLAVQQSGVELSVIGHDRNADLAQIALEMDAIEKLELDVRTLASKADILVLAVPFNELEPLLTVIGDVVQPQTLVLDMSPLKAPGLKLADQLLQQGHYVGARPVFSSDWLVDGRTEVEAASGDVFKNGVFCLMPSPKADPKAVETAVNFGHLIGALPYFFDAAEFDGLQTGLQTVPGLLAAALFGSVSTSTGWRDMLRFANVPFAMSTQPLAESTDLAHEAFTNKIATMRWLDGLIDELKLLRQQVYEGDEEILVATLAGLAEERAKWLADREKNDWVEGVGTAMDADLQATHYLGVFAKLRKKEERD